MKKINILLTILFILFFAAGCKTTQVNIPEGLNPAEFFQKAQEASSNGKYDIALTYYTTFLERYPDDIQRGIEAEYEIAFIAYKRHDFDKAKQLFEELLDRYSIDASQVLPSWPKVLAQKVLKEIKSY